MDGRGVVSPNVRRPSVLDADAFLRNIPIDPLSDDVLPLPCNVPLDCSASSGVLGRGGGLYPIIYNQ